MHLMEKEAAISYDLIHVCKKRGLAQCDRIARGLVFVDDIRERARAEIRAHRIWAIWKRSPVACRCKYRFDRQMS